MAITVNVEELSEKGNKKDRKKETKHIRAGNRVARLVSYVELGKHNQMFQGKQAVYETGKNRGCKKPAVLHVGLTFEFPAEPYTGDYPLTISTTRRMDTGEFFDAVTVPDDLANGSMSKAFALKTKFMKFLVSLQNATGKTYGSLAEFAKEQPAVLVNVTNRLGAKDEDGHQPVYANMKPDGITAPRFEHPVTGDIQEIPVPAAIETYCTVFDWDAPTPEAWESLKPWDQKAIKAALNFGGSPCDLMLTANPDLDKIENSGKNAADSVSDGTPEAPPEPPPHTAEDMPV